MRGWRGLERWHGKGFGFRMNRLRSRMAGVRGRRHWLRLRDGLWGRWDGVHGGSPSPSTDNHGVLLDRRPGVPPTLAIEATPDTAGGWAWLVSGTGPVSGCGEADGQQGHTEQQPDYVVTEVT